MAKKLVWLNIETGEFSNSWNEKDYIDSSCSTHVLIEQAKDCPSWKLIEYECLNDEDFELMHLMRLR